MSEKHFGENEHKPPDCSTKETSDADVYPCPPQKQNNKKPSCNHLPLFLSPFILSPAFPPPPLTFPLSLLCSRGFVTVCVYFSDRLGLICTTAVESKGWHVILRSGTEHTGTDEADFDTMAYYSNFCWNSHFCIPLTPLWNLPVHISTPALVEKCEQGHYPLFIESI